MAIELAEAYVQIIPSAKGIKGMLNEEMGGEAESAGKETGNKMGSSLVSTLKKVVVAAGIGKIVSSALSEGADLQQSFGGLDTIYEDASEAAKKYAQEAAKAGISANDYAEQAVSFGASLKQAFEGDTTKAVEAANVAIMDMTDNAAKMGTPIESIQSAYQGFAKQNYTMLDNLKLGYGGTKTEMERLLKDAQKISGVEYNMDNLGDVYDAIHVIQGELGLTGVAAQEASETFSGSLGAMKASFTNLLANLTTGGDITGSLTMLGESISNFAFNNLIPMLGNIFKQIPTILFSVIDNAPQLVTAVLELLGTIGTSIAEFDWMGFAQTMLEHLKTSLSTIATNIFGEDGFITPNMIEGIKKKLPELGTMAVEMIAKIAATIGQNLPKIISMGFEIITKLIVGILQAIPKIITALPQVFSTIKQAFAKFDWKSIGSDIINGLINGIKNSFAKIGSAAKELGSFLLDKVKGVFKIGSPSKIMRDEVGKWIPEGIAVGILGNTNTVASAMQNVADVAVGNVNGTIAGNIRSNAALSRGTLGVTGGSDIYDLLANTLPQIASGQNVTITLQGGAEGIFRTVRKQNDVYKRSTGMNAFA